MTVTASTVEFRDVVDGVVQNVVAPAAPEIDRTGAFPRTSIQALQQAGALGVLSASEVGGAGRSLRTAAEVVERVSTACGSTAMIVLMHYAAVAAIEAHGPRDVRE